LLVPFNRRKNNESSILFSTKRKFGFFHLPSYQVNQNTSFCTQTKVNLFVSWVVCHILDFVSIRCEAATKLVFSKKLNFDSNLMFAKFSMSSCIKQLCASQKSTFKRNAKKWKSYNISCFSFQNFGLNSFFVGLEENVNSTVYL
jgi:hypothetical protein